VTAGAHEFPGLEVVARQAMAAAEKTLPPEVGVGILLAFHTGRHEGGLAWVAGVTRESAISLVCEWLAHEARDEGHGETVKAALEYWMTSNRKGKYDPHRKSADA